MDGIPRLGALAILISVSYTLGIMFLFIYKQKDDPKQQTRLLRSKQTM